MSYVDTIMGKEAHASHCQSLSVYRAQRVMLRSPNSWKGPQNHNENGDPESPFSWGPPKIYGTGPLREVSGNDLIPRYTEEAVSLAIEQQKLELGNLCDRQPWH